MATKKKAKKKSSKSNGSAPKKRRIPRQQIIPGVGDEKIAAIENAALDYAEVRDERMALSQKEVDLKGKLLDLMHAKKLKEYKRANISVVVKMEQETVKVSVKSEEDLDDEPADLSPDDEGDEDGVNVELTEEQIASS